MSQTKENKNETTDDLTKAKETQEQLRAAILLSVNLESDFKLYSYRILDPETFVETTKQRVEEYFKLSNIS